MIRAKWWHPAKRENPLFDWIDVLHWLALGLVLGIAFCVLVNEHFAHARGLY